MFLHQINNSHFFPAIRNVLNKRSLQKSFSPKRRWDQNAFGYQKQKLTQHVASILLQQDKDSQILEKFRRQAEEVKIKKRKEKFPHLFQRDEKLNEGYLENQQTVPQTFKKTNNINNMNNRSRIYSLNNEGLNKSRQNSFIPIQQSSYKNYEQTFKIPYSNPNPTFQYQQILALKNKQILKNQSIIKKQSKQISKLKLRLKSIQKQTELQKLIKQNQQISSLKNMLSGLREQIKQQNQQIDWKLSHSMKQQSKDSRVKFIQNSSGWNSKQMNVRKNKSEMFLQSKEAIPLSDYTQYQQNQSFRNQQVPQQYQQTTSIQRTKQPSIHYSPKVDKKTNRLSVFAQLSKRNILPIPENIQSSLNQLKNRDHRLDRPLIKF